MAGFSKVNAEWWVFSVFKMASLLNSLATTRSKLWHWSNYIIGYPILGQIYLHLHKLNYLQGQCNQKVINCKFTSNESISWCPLMNLAFHSWSYVIGMPQGAFTLDRTSWVGSTPLRGCPTSAPERLSSAALASISNGLGTSEKPSKPV